MGRPPLPIGTWGDVSVTKEPSGAWRASARYRGEDGRTRTYSRRRPTKGEAKRALLDHLATLRDTMAGGTITRDSTVAALADHWMQAWQEAAPRTSGTVRTYRLQLKKIRSRLGGVRVGEVTTGRLDAVVQGVRRDSGDETARQVRVLLRQIFSEAVRLDAIRSNPAADTQTVTIARPQARGMTSAEVGRLRTAAAKWEAAPRRSTRPWARFPMKASIDLMLGTGVRVGEMLGLRRVEDVNLGGTPLVHVAGTVARDAAGRTVRQPAPKSESSDRTLYLPAFTVASLHAHLDTTEPAECGALFPSSAGTWMDADNYRAHFREVRKLAGLEWVTPHTIRATVATQVYRSGDLATASSQLGHSEVGVTSRHYVERENRGPAEVVGLLDAFVSVS